MLSINHNILSGAGNNPYRYVNASQHLVPLNAIVVFLFYVL